MNQFFFFCFICMFAFTGLACGGNSRLLKEPPSFIEEQRKNPLVFSSSQAFMTTASRGQYIEISSLPSFSEFPSKEAIEKDLAEPLEILKITDGLYNKVDKMANDNYSDVLFKQMKQHPVALLGECTADHCVNNRFLNPKAREYFAKAVMDAIGDRIGKKKDPQRLHVTFWGSGFLFSAFLQVVELLNRFQFASLEIDLLDKSYEEQIYLLKSHSSGDVGLAVCEGHKKREMFINSQNIRVVTFANMIHTLYPHLDFRLRVFGDMEDFVADFQQEHVASPDIIVGEDFEGEIEGFGAYMKAVAESTRVLNEGGRLLLLPWSGHLRDLEKKESAQKSERSLGWRRTDEMNEIEARYKRSVSKYKFLRGKAHFDDPSETEPVR